MLVWFKHIKSLPVCSYIGYRSLSVEKQGRHLMKLIEKGRKRMNRNPISGPFTLTESARKTLYGHETKRMKMLSKMYFTNICDILSTHAYEELSEYGIEIIEVKVSHDCNTVFIYWASTKEINETKVNEVLLNVTNKVKSEINEIRLMSSIPNIRFVMHKEYFKEREVNQIVNIIQKELQKFSHLQRENLSSNEEMASDEPDEYEVHESQPIAEYMPSTTDDVFNLNRPAILREIYMAKSNLRTGGNQVEKESFGVIQNNAVVFDKKELSKVLFRDQYRLKKMRKSEDHSREYNFTEETFDLDNSYSDDENEIIDMIEKFVPEEGNPASVDGLAKNNKE